MSSALLFLAIVAIWAVVLVPRWLRNAHPVEADADPELADAGEAPSSAAGDADGVRAEARVDAERPAAPATRTAAPDGAASWDRSASQAGATEPQPPVQAPAARPGGQAVTTARRARVLRARRRTLVALVLLTAGAAAIAFSHLAASWVSIPPAVLLLFFLLLLRTAARVDAQRAYEGHLRARNAAAAARPTRAEGAPATAPAATAPAATADATAAAAADTAVPDRTTGGAEPRAEVIDISARIQDQPYDQYLDAESRAVGD